MAAAQLADGVRIGVLAVQGDFREHLQHLRSLGVDAVPVRRVGEVDGVDGLIIPGGESSVIDKLTRAFGLAEPISRRIAAGMPVYGTCAGLIMLADRVEDAIEGQRNFGGLHVVARRNAFGSQLDSFEEDLDVPAVGSEPVRAVFIRAPLIEEAEGDVDVLARLHDGRMVAVRQGTLLATSFHPEVTGDLRFHEYFVEMVRGARERVQ